ncbi:hypothetical protein FA13DRAFT_1712323 [Coprinellus micaceus]|uniref:Uncharacterized protein n=1 Tax=Coprinellus micaceus TaxID=71717 RepID=A0A4Y7T2C1_COPMI|nr:hypothetical protein FA13DRAFT_1712323 [Coprinellus micaceus]
MAKKKDSPDPFCAHSTAVAQAAKGTLPGKERRCFVFPEAGGMERGRVGGACGERGSHGEMEWGWRVLKGRAHRGRWPFRIIREIEAGQIFLPRDGGPRADEEGVGRKKDFTQTPSVVPSRSAPHLTSALTLTGNTSLRMAWLALTTSARMLSEECTSTSLDKQRQSTVFEQDKGEKGEDVG